jgi:chromosome partitioning protein
MHYDASGGANVENGEKQIINHTEAVKMTGLDTRMLSRMIIEKEIPYTKSGREKLYNVDDLKSLIGVTKSVPAPKVYAVASPKGGTGKTTVIKYAVKILSNYGRSVNVVDADPQHYFTTWAGNYLSEENHKRLKDCNLLTFLRGEKKLVKCVIPLFKGVDFVAGLRKLEHYDRELASEVGRELLLKNALAPALPRYDVILIDTSPAQSAVTMAALIAAHSIIIPVMPEIDSFEAARDLVKTIANIKSSGLNDKFKLQEINILPIKHRSGIIRSKLSKQIMSDIRGAFDDSEFFTDVRVRVLGPVYEHDSIPLENYRGTLDDSSAAYKNFEAVLKEVFNYE